MLLRTRLKSFIVLVMALGLIKSSFGYSVKLITPVGAGSQLPKIALYGENLLILKSKNGELSKYSTVTKKTTLLKKGLNIPLSLTLNKQGQGAICYNVGKNIFLFDLSDPNSLNGKSITIDTYQDIFCYDLAFSDRPSESQLLWVGAPSDFGIHLIDPHTIIEESLENHGDHHHVEPGLRKHVKIIRTIKNVSGALKVELSSQYIWSLNGQSNPNKSLPLVLERDTGKAVLGHKLARVISPKLKRTFSRSFFSDPLANSVTYFNVHEHKLFEIPMGSPSLESAVSYPANVANPQDLDRYQNCYLVMGKHQNKNSWSIFKKTEKSIEHLRKIVSDHLPLHSSGLKQVVSKQGTVYLSTRIGVYSLEGLFDGLNCEARE